MKKVTLSKFEAISILLICFINESIINFSQNFIVSTGSGAIINLIEVSTIAFIFCFILTKLFKNFSNSDIIDISEYLGGSFLKCLIAIIFVLFFILTSAFTISSFSYLLKTVYFHESPIIFVSGLFILGMLVANLIGLDSIKKTSCFIIPFLLICISIIFFSSLKNFTMYKLTPILGNDLKTTFLKGLSNLFVFNIIIYYYFILPLLKNKNDFSKILFSSFTITIIILIIILICLLTAFPYFGSSDELNPIYIITRSIELTDFLQRIDAVFVYFSIISTFIYNSILLFWIIEILRKIICI